MNIWAQLTICGIVIMSVLPMLWLSSIVRSIKSAAKSLEAIKKDIADLKKLAIAQGEAVQQISDNLAEVGNHIIERG